jgi:hypothetical protein
LANLNAFLFTLDAAANVLLLQFLGIEAGFSALPIFFPYRYYDLYVIYFDTN